MWHLVVSFVVRMQEPHQSPSSCRDCALDMRAGDCWPCGFKTGALYHGRIVCARPRPFSACLLSGVLSANRRNLCPTCQSHSSLAHEGSFDVASKAEKMSWDASTVHQGQHGSEMRPRSGFGSSKEHCHWRSSSENRHSLPDSFLGRGPGVRSQDCAAGGIGSFPPSGLPLGLRPLPGPCLRIKQSAAARIVVDGASSFAFLLNPRRSLIDPLFQCKQAFRQSAPPLSSPHPSQPTPTQPPP